MILSCSDSKNPTSKLDRENGFQGLVLGDSSYSDFMKEVKENASESDIIEREIFGNVIVQSEKIENLDNRFVYGVLMNNLYGGALNGKIYMYNLVNNDTDSSSQQKILDSLKTNYGPPTLTKDTTFTVFSTDTIKYHQNIWEGKKVKMMHLVGSEWENHVNRLQILDISAEKKLNDISERIDSLSKYTSQRLSGLKSVGNLVLSSTKEELLNKDILETDEREVSEDYTMTNYRINYGQYLQPFFDIENKRKYRYGESRIIETDLNFHSKTDSLRVLNINFDNDEISYSDILNILGKKFGEYSFEEKLRTNSATYRRSFWLSKDLIIVLEDKGYFDEISVAFHVNERPYYLNF